MRKSIKCVYAFGVDDEHAVKDLEKQLNKVINKDNVLDVRDISISSISNTSHLVGCVIVEERD